MNKPKFNQQVKNNWVENLIINPSHPYKIIFTVCLTLYIQVLTFGLVHFDDHGFVLLSSDLLKLSNIPDFFKHSVFWVFGDANQNKDVFYRPLQNIVYAICNTLSNKQPFGYHLVGLILHILTSCVLFNFLKELKYNVSVCLVFTLIYCTHPVLVQAVAWIGGVGDQMAALFLLIAATYFIKSIPNQNHINKKYVFIHLASFAAALYSKEIAILLIPICLFYLLFLHKNKTSKSTILIISIGWAVLAITYLILRNNAVPSNEAGIISSAIGSFKMNGFLAFEYIEKIAVPFRLSPIPSRDDARFMVGAGIVLALALIFIFKKRVTVLSVFGILWFFVFLFPSFIQSNPQKPFYAYEHRLYVPFIGILIVIMELIKINHFNFNSKYYKYGFSVLLLAFFTITFSYSRTFKNAYGFFDRVIALSPKSVLAYNAYASLLLEDKKYAAAVETYKKSFQYDSADLQTSGKIADVYLKNLNNPQEAIVWFKKTLEIDPNSVEAAVSIGDTYFNFLHDTSNAELWYNNALKINFNNTFALSSLGIIYVNKGKHIEGRKLLLRSIEQNEKNLNALKWTAISYFNEGNITEAVTYLNTAYVNYPDDTDLQRNLMICYYKLNDYALTEKFTSIYYKSKNQIPAEIENYLKNKGN